MSTFSASRDRSSRISGSGSESAQESSSINPLKADGVSAEGLKEIMQVLESSGLPGPSIVWGDLQHIGTGGQAVVYSAWGAEPTNTNAVVFPIAVKHPIFAVDPDTPLELINRFAQRHLKDLATEVKALTTPFLHGHPNIVRLFSWSFDTKSIHKPPLLVEELAASDLHKLLLNGDDISHEQRYIICSDIASGLDAVHECDFVHGDLKPRNILLFREEGRLIAKLADFGLSVGDYAENTPSIRLMGTPGWEAPEVESGQLLTPEGAVKADHFSFGLVAACTLLGCAAICPDQNTATRQTYIASQMGKFEFENLPGHGFMEPVEKAVLALLDNDPAQRPKVVQDLFSREITLTSTWRQESAYGESTDEQSEDEESAIDENEGVMIDSRDARGLRPVSHAFMRGMLPHAMKNLEEASPRLIFECFLHMTTDDFKPLIGVTKKPEYSTIEVLMAAVRRNLPPAQSVLLTALEFYGESLSDELDPLVLKCLAESVATGSTLARTYLHRKDESLLTRSLHRFRMRGGYSSHYRDGPLKDPLHWLAEGGTLEEVREYLSTNPGTDLDRKTDIGETSVFLACARAAWDVAVELINAGADASIPCTDLNITCLHWIFAFDSDDLGMAIDRLLEAGMDIDARASEPLFILHYPFELPAGTPLHWAVVTHSHDAIKKLVGHGASLDIRDGSDPYRLDDRVRMLRTFSSLNDGPHSFSEVGTQGLSAMDYAALEHDPYLFEILTPGQYDPILSVDEEGFSVLHRLSSNAVRRTPAGIPFSFLPFQGAPTRTKENLRRIVAAVKSLGGDLEQLTTPNIALAQMRQSKGSEKLVKEWERYSPLMLAALNGRADIVAVLLDAGADPNSKTPKGKTALHCLSRRTTDATSVCKLLISAGARVLSMNNLGTTPLQLAAESHNPELVDLLLEAGADLEDIKAKSGSAFIGMSVLGLLSNFSLTLNKADDSYDKATAGLLEKWLLHSCDAEKRSRIVLRQAPENGTLLHTYAGELMPLSVAVLIRCEAPINAVFQNTRTIPWKDYCEETTSYKTPLDVAVALMKRYQDHQRDRGFPDDTITHYDDICRRADAVIAAIQAAGGVRSELPQLVVPLPKTVLRPWSNR